MPKHTLMDENDEFLSGINYEKLDKGDAMRLVHRLRTANERLKAVADQANAQFKVGDRHATFNKQTIEAITEPLTHGKPKSEKKPLWNPT